MTQGAEIPAIISEQYDHDTDDVRAGSVNCMGEIYN